MIALGLVVVQARAQVNFNKCVGKDGKVVYTDGRCPAGAKGDPNFNPEEPAPVPALSWDKQVFARWCVDRWRTEASPAARAEVAASLRQQAEAGAERVREYLDRTGLTIDEAIQAQVDKDLAQPFNSDCLQFGFRRVGASSDEYNEQMSRALENELNVRYPDSKRNYDRARTR